MTAGRCDQQEIPLRDHLVETQGKQLAGLQIGQGKILHHAADAQGAKGKLDNHITGGKLEFRLEGNVVFGKKIFHVMLGAGIAFETDKGQRF